MQRIAILQKMQLLLSKIQQDIVALNGGSNQMLRCAKENTLIPQKVVENLFLHLQTVEQAQEELRQLYAQLNRSDDMPNSVSKLQDIIKKETELEEKRQIIVGVSEQFNLLHSKTIDLELLLERHKAKLSQLDVNKLSNAQCNTLIKPYQQFLLAVTETNPMKLYDYIQSLHNKFEKELIVYATLCKRIFIQESDSEMVQEQDIELQSQTEQEKTIVQILNTKEETDSVISSARSEKESEVLKEELAEEKMEEDVKEEITLTKEEETLQGEMIVIAEKNSVESPEPFLNFAEDITLESLNLLGTVKIRKGSQDNARLMLMKFRGDINKHPINSSMFRAIFQYEFVTLSYLMGVCHSSAKVVERELEKMLQKGYIRSYELNPFEVFFSPSPKGYQVLDSLTAMEVLNCQIIDVNSYERERDESVPSMITKSLYTKLMEITSRASGIWLPLGQKYMSRDMFLQFICPRKEEVDFTILVGMLIYDSMQMEGPFQEICKKIKLARNFLRMVAIGLNLQQARKVVDLLLPTLKEKGSEEQIYCYAYDKNKCYAYMTSEEVSLSQVWNQPVPSIENTTAIQEEPKENVEEPKETVQSKEVVIDESESSIQPSEEEESSIQPLEEEESSIQPLEEEEPSIQPLEEEEPSIQPLEEEESSIQPSEEEEPSIQPLEEEEPSIQPLEEESSIQPLEEEESSIQPLEEEESSIQPLEEEEPSIQPLEEEEPSIQPSEEEEPSVLPLEEQHNQEMGDITPISLETKIPESLVKLDESEVLPFRPEEKTSESNSETKSEPDGSSAQSSKEEKNVSEQEASQEVQEEILSPVSDKQTDEFSAKIEQSFESVVSDVVYKKALSAFERQKMIEEYHSILATGKLYCATAYLKAATLLSDSFEILYQQLAYAVNDPMNDCCYTSDNIFSLYTDDVDTISDYYMISSVLRNYFLNHIEHDYNAKSLFSNLAGKEILANHPDLGNVIYMLLQFKLDMDKGIDVYADYRNKNRAVWEKKLAAIQQDAREAYKYFILNHRTETNNNRRFVMARKLLLEKENELETMLKSVANNDIEMYSYLEALLKEDFIKDNAKVDVVNIDSNKVIAFMNLYWEKAAEHMNSVKESSDLMTSLRNNLYYTILKIVKIACRWVMLGDTDTMNQNDAGMIRYKKEKLILLSSMKGAMFSLQEQLSNVKQDNLVLAGGIQVLLATLSELIARLEGDYEEEEQMYFYIDFLRDEYVQLTEDYIPDFKPLFLDLEDFSLFERIRKHTKKQSKEESDFQSRLDEIFNNYGDDYGSANLIGAYLKKMKGVSLLNYNMEESRQFAQKEATQELNQFVEDLELAQSYGQIDNAKGDKKEEILQNVNEWYEYLNQTGNFGFFKKILEQYKVKISKEAQSRGKVLTRELEHLEKNNPELLENELVKKNIKRIQEMLQIQNYTVAEDLLNRIASNELEDSVSIFQTDYLEDFYDRYEYLYKRVADSSKSLNAMTLSSSRSNKDTRGGKRLIENWLSNGGHLGEQKLEYLLRGLGFDVDMVQEQERINRIENYNVNLKHPGSGRKSNFKHPIAVFGSKAIETDFRVICLYGKFDTDRLIDIAQSLGNAKHSIVLLDYALSLAERRRLARKIKQASNNKIFAVLDRVMLMYLADNYAETSINRVLMMVMMPFSYYQPYVVDSVNAMPPEMFMGRKRELDEIESSTGANIVYGGRQLGKSALLRMAKNDIDQNENHDRAVLVEIKGLDYKKAAKKIAYALFDEGVLLEEIETDDWEELARAIRKRLMSQTEPRIPYLLLLLDEADAFIESCESINYQPFDALKDIQNVGIDRFKFVIAGLRNIVRFKKEVALGNNSVLTHLKSITVTPFKVQEARELLEVPLYYLGLRLPKEKDSLISLILASTNYFPGLIQLYCAKLIEAMKKNDYAGYAESDTPPYEVEEVHIKKVLADSELRRQIREKFEITLELDEDHYYYIIALLLANLCHMQGFHEGYSAEDVKNLVEDLGIGCMRELSVEKIAALMDELCELNVLRRTTSERYLYYRYSFFQMMGSAQEVDEKILKYME